MKNRLSHVGNKKKKKKEIVALFQPIEREGSFPLYARARERIRKFRTIFNDKNTNDNFKPPIVLWRWFCNNETN